MKTLPWMALTFVALFVRVGSSFAESRVGENGVEQAPNKIGRLFARTKTVCVGRYLLDVPESATVVYGPANTPYRINRLPGRASELMQMVEEYSKEAVSKKSKFPIGPASSPGSLVGQVAKGFSDNNRIVYGVEEMTGAYYLIQSLVVVGADIYVQEHSYYGELDGLQKVVEELKMLAASIVPRTAEGVPSGVGVCIDGALVLDQATTHHERTTVGVRLSEFNDVHFTIDMTLKDRLIESDALEARLKSGEENAKAEGKMEWYSKIKFIRRMERQVSSWKGYEALARRPLQGQFTAFHEFSFVSQGEPKNPMLPVINVDLYTGVQDNTVGLGIPSLNDVEAIELWDRLMNSIRPICPAAK